MNSCKAFHFAALLLSWATALPTVLAASARQGTVQTERFTSEILRDNLIGLDPRRSICVYLPPGYHESSQSYPVVYYFHSIGWSNERMFAGDKSVQAIFDRAIARGAIREFILVAADYTTGTLGTFYGNNPVSGRWFDYTLHEVLPYVETHYRTLRDRNSRAVAGDFLGGYAAIKAAMLHPEVFSVVYALHPVGTGSGLMPSYSMVDWKKLHQARSFSDLRGDYYAPGFVAMAQAYLPNPQRPPFYCDFIVEMEDGVATPKPDHLSKLQAGFHLDQLLQQYAENLRTMRGIGFDWGRYDTTQGHVYSNQAFTRKLDQLAIQHVGEEYNGGSNDKNWIEHGRVEDRMLPFLDRYLVFEEAK